MFDYQGKFIFTHDEIKTAMQDYFAEIENPSIGINLMSIRDTAIPNPDRLDEFFQQRSGYSRFLSACWRIDFTRNDNAPVCYKETYYIYCRNKTADDLSITNPSSLLIGKVEEANKFTVINNPHYEAYGLKIDNTTYDTEEEIVEALEKVKQFTRTEVMDVMLKDMGVKQ